MTSSPDRKQADMYKRNLPDVGVGVAAFSAPEWLHFLEFWAQHFVVLGGAVLVLARLIVMFQDMGLIPRRARDASKDN